MTGTFSSGRCLLHATQNEICPMKCFECDFNILIMTEISEILVSITEKNHSSYAKRWILLLLLDKLFFVLKRSKWKFNISKREESPNLFKENEKRILLPKKTISKKKLLWSATAFIAKPTYFKSINCFAHLSILRREISKKNISYNSPTTYGTRLTIKSAYYLLCSFFSQQVFFTRLVTILTGCHLQSHKSYNLYEIQREKNRLLYFANRYLVSFFFVSSLNQFKNNCKMLTYDKLCVGQPTVLLFIRYL